MEKIIETNTEHGDLSHYYGEWHVSGELEEFLDSIEGQKIKITIETID